MAWGNIGQFFDGLLTHRDKFHQILEAIPACVSWISADDKYLYVNSKLAAAYGLTSADFSGRDIGFIKINTPFAQVIKRFRASQEMKFTSEIPLEMAGETRWHLLIAEKSEQSEEILIISVDITTRKASEQGLIESELRFRQVIESAPDAICFVSEGKIIYSNPRMVRLLDHDNAGQLMHKPLADLFNSDDLERLLNPSHLLAEYTLRKRSSKTVQVEIATIQTEYKGLAATLIFARDISDRKERQELISAKKAAEEALTLKRKFISNISHEIRTPMNGVMGLTDLLLKTPINDEQRDYLNAIRKSSEMMVVIINDILDFEKLQAGKMELELVPMKIDEIIDSVIELQLPSASGKRILVEKTYAPAIKGHHMGDPVRLNQILTNLISNAIKFTEKGKVSVHCSIREEQGEQQFIEFKVTDTGIGISKDKLSVIFESFTQASSNTSRKYGGTGLGLTIAKELVERHGGHISVESEISQGTTFTVVIPYKKAKADQVPKKDSQSVSFDKTSLNGLRVLLAEDNPINLLIAKKVMLDLGLVVDTAENGRVALDKLQQQRYDLFVTDIQMPEMDGLTASSTIRKKFPPPLSEIPILALTAYASKDELDECLRAGVNETLTKPFKAEKLYEKIAQLTGKTAAQFKNKRTLVEIKSFQPKHIDLNYLRETLDGDFETITEMFSLFGKRLPTLIEKMNKELNDPIPSLESASGMENVEQRRLKIKIVSHDLKSNFGYLGVLSGAQLAQETERMAKDGSPLKEIHFKMGALVGLIEEVLSEVKRIQKELS